MGIIQKIKEEIEIIKERDPALHSNMEVFLYPSFRAILYYRVAHHHFMKKRYVLARWISQRGARKTGIEIHPGATIGKGLFIDHGHGVIIGETAIVGDNVTIYQGVTLGGTGKEHGKRHPTIEDNVMISAGAKVLGSFTIGEGSKIGAGSVVLREVPPHCTVVGVPGHIVKSSDQNAIPSHNMDQVNLPDPMQEEIKAILKQNKLFEERIKGLEEVIDTIAKA
ncbi:MAG: serine O-acetyltransferase EpsC [Lachnospiraceae bacterium]